MTDPLDFLPTSELLPSGSTEGTGEEGSAGGSGSGGAEKGLEGAARLPGIDGEERQLRRLSLGPGTNR